jgi:glyoxylase-like metal-dependent hydrolase (beta-lactamase superfamily II)
MVLSEVTPSVFVSTSRRYMTTSTVVVSDHGRALLVDPAWDPDELDALADELKARGIVVEAGVATHFHYDHLLWHPEFGDAPRWASATTVEIVTERRSELLSMLGSDWPAELAELFGSVEPLPSLDAIGWSGPTATPILHDAHALGHLAIWIEAEGLLIAGDTLSDVEIPLPDDDGGLASYVEGLSIIEPWVRNARTLVPGHGTVTNKPLDRLDADRRYLKALLAGELCEDTRLSNPGMLEAHERNRGLAFK